MPLPPMRSLVRDRRRISLVVVLAYLGLRLSGPAALATPLTAAAGALGLGGLAAGLSLCAPRLRSFSEAIALAGFGLALLVWWLPGSALDPAAAAGHPWVSVAFLFGLTALGRGLRRGLRSLGWPLLHDRRFKARASSRVDIHRLWYGLVPSAALAWGAGTSGREPVAETGLRIGRVCPLPPAAAAQPDALGTRDGQGTQDPQGTPSAPGVQIIEIEPPFHIRMRDWGTNSQGVIGEAGESEIFLVELGPQRLVLFAHVFSELPLGRAFLAWLDDMPGRLLDRRLALIERRARAEDDQRARRLSPDALAAWDADAERDGTNDCERDDDRDATASASERQRNAS